jgi:hypothetical protein
VLQANRVVANRRCRRIGNHDLHQPFWTPCQKIDRQQAHANPGRSKPPTPSALLPPKIRSGSTPALSKPLELKIVMTDLAACSMTGKAQSRRSLKGCAS